MQNPLLAPTVCQHEVDFSVLTADHFVAALETLMPEVQAEHEVTLRAAPTYANLFECDDKSRQLQMVVGLLSHLVSVAATDDLRAVHDAYLPKVSRLMEELNLDVRGYEKLLEFMQTPEYGTLSPLHQKMVREGKKSYEIEGIHLPAEKKSRLIAIQERLAEVCQQFDNNLTDFAAQATVVFQREALQGVPERTLHNLTPQADGSFQASMAEGDFDDILTYCEVEATRKTVYDMSLGQGVAAQGDNRPLVNEIVALKQERAQLLGYACYADYAIEDSLAARKETALAFVRKLADSSLEKARAEATEFEAFGAKLLGRKMAFHDTAYVIEQYEQQRYALDNEALRQYFPVDHVVSATLSILEELYAIRFVANPEKSVWHQDVTVYDVREESSHALLGTLYLDLYARKHKEAGAWMNGIVSRHITSKACFLPVSYVVCDAPKDKGSTPTMEYSEVFTLFHELGHALHNLLTEVDEEFFSGLNQVPQDAIELPSQFMENFVRDFSMLQRLTKHVVTGESLPVELYQRIVRAREFLIANVLLGQSRYALLDLALYSDPNAEPAELEEAIAARYQVSERDPNKQLLPSFSHIFTGGYAAAYYVYQWAEMLAMDAFAALREQGPHYAEQREAAMRFRRLILATGGRDSLLDNFRMFRGRDPEMGAMLKHYRVE